MTVAANHLMQEIYDVVYTHNMIVVGGADGTVGFGGYLTGVQHSPISAKFGLAVDNAYEMLVVTANGNVIITNEYQYSDFFCAMRGGKYTPKALFKL